MCTAGRLELECDGDGEHGNFVSWGKKGKNIAIDGYKWVWEASLYTFCFVHVPHRI